MTIVATTKDTQRQLPSGWRWVRLGDVCEFLDYRRKPISEAERAKRIEGKRVEDLYPYYGANGQAGWIDDYLFDEPLILLAEDGGAFGSSDTPIAYKIEGKTWVNNHAHVLRPFSGIDFDYCLASISIRPDLANLATGNTRPKLNQNVAASIPIPFAPLSEQQRIAGWLNEQMAVVEKARAAAQARLEAVRALPAAFLRQVFPQPGQPLPDGWRWVRLGEVCQGPGQYGTSVKSNSEERGVPVLGMYHIHEGRIRWKNVSHVDLQPDELPKYLLCKGDLLFNRTNSAELVGKTAVFDDDRPAVFASYLIRFRFNEGLADPYFVSAFINSRSGRRFIEKKMARAIGQVNISASTMREMPLPLPPLREQRRITATFREQMTSVDKARAAAQEELNTINALPAALLRKAFRGEI